MNERFDRLFKQLAELQTKMQRMESNNPQRFELKKQIEKLNERINRTIEF